MDCIQCPDEISIDDPEAIAPVVFLAGGITGCPDWQSDLINLLRGEDIVVLNPRRDNWPINDPSASEEQIKWEFNNFFNADIISFWFPKETLCPITLYELGWVSGCEPVFDLAIGIEPGYERELDVRIQTKLRVGGMDIVDNLQDLANQIIQKADYV
jgi:hypothetical protein